MAHAAHLQSSSTVGSDRLLVTSCFHEAPFTPWFFLAGKWLRGSKVPCSGFGNDVMAAFENRNEYAIDDLEQSPNLGMQLDTFTWESTSIADTCH